MSWLLRRARGFSLTALSARPLRNSLVAGAVVVLLAVAGYQTRKLLKPPKPVPVEEPVVESPAGEPWPQWRGPQRDGVAPPGAIRTDWDARPPAAVWSAPCGGGFSSFAIARGRVTSQDRTADGERVFCLAATSGAQLWEYRYPADYAPMNPSYARGPRATPSVAGNRVFAVGAVGKLVCLEPPPTRGTPRVVWEHDLIAEFDGKVPDYGVACSPLIEGDLVVVQPGGKTGSVVAFDRETGAVRWKAGANPAGYSSPVAATVGGVRVVYALTGDALLCVRAADGEVLGSFPWKTQFQANVATPVVVGDSVFVTSAYNKGCALLRAVPKGDRFALEPVYVRENRVLRSHQATPVFRDGFLYGFDGTQNTFPRCVDLRKGREEADWGEGSEIRCGSLLLADKHLVVLTERGRLALIEARPDEFNVVANVPSGLAGTELWTVPVLVEGRLYLRGGDRIVCLDVRADP